MITVFFDQKKTLGDERRVGPICITVRFYGLRDAVITVFF